MSGTSIIAQIFVPLSHLVKTSPEGDRISIPSLQDKLQGEKKKVSIIRQR